LAPRFGHGSNSVPIYCAESLNLLI
jgi:hypothetical protein